MKCVTFRHDYLLHQSKRSSFISRHQQTSGTELGSPDGGAATDGTATGLTVAYERFLAFLSVGWHTGCMGKRKIKAVWSDADRQAFADGFRLRSVRFLDKQKQNAKYFCRQQYERYYRPSDE